MKELKFPYISLKGEFYPIIPVTLVKGKESVLTTALVDSGQPLVCFKALWASI